MYTRRNQITARDKCMPAIRWNVLALGSGEVEQCSSNNNVCHCTEKFDGKTESLNFQTELYCQLPKHFCSNQVTGTKINSKCFHATIFCLLIIFGHKNNSKAIKEQLKPTFKMPRRQLSLRGLNLTHGCLMKANIQTLQYSTETLLISDVMK